MTNTFTYCKNFARRMQSNVLHNEECEVRLCKHNTPKKSSRYFIVYMRNVAFVMVILTLIILYRAIALQESEYAKLVPASARHFLTFEELNEPMNLNISQLKELFEAHNKYEELSNLCPLHEQWNGIILVIRVKRLTLTLKYLLVSLSTIQGIEEVLLVFSHSYYDEDLNRLIRSIDFCRVQQIFYPYSLQVYPDSFPGHDPKDCPYDMDSKAALRINCTGAYTPDVLGNFRHPERAEDKHHWWWTANKVFEDLKFNRDREGMVVFLDDDVYLLQDFLYVLLYLKGTVGLSIPSAEFISFGAPSVDTFNFDPFEYATKTDILKISTWNPEFHSSVLAFDLDTWNIIAGHYDLFCNIDDYSWSRTLLELSESMSISKKKQSSFKVITLGVPRAYKISYDGYFDKINRHTVFTNAYQVTKFEMALRTLYPQSFRLHVIKDDKVFDGTAGTWLRGGWSDPRDRQLCQNMTLRKIKKYFFSMATQLL